MMDVYNKIKMATPKYLPLVAVATSIALVGVPMIGLGGGQQATMRLTLNVSPSSSFKVQNAADLAPSGFSAMSPPAPVLFINSPPVMPQVVVEVSVDVAGPATSKPTGDLGGEFGAQDGGNGGKQVALKDLGVAPPPLATRRDGSDLKEAFERAAGEIIYRLDLLNKINVGRDLPVVVSINL